MTVIQGLKVEVLDTKVVIHFPMRTKVMAIRIINKVMMKRKRLLGDSGYDCNLCNGKNHFA